MWKSVEMAIWTIRNISYFTKKMQSIKERRSLSGARERRSQKCERERERRSEKNLRARARAALGKIRERLATSGALQISENDLSK